MRTGKLAVEILKIKSVELYDNIHQCSNYKCLSEAEREGPEPQSCKTMVVPRAAGAAA